MVTASRFFEIEQLHTTQRERLLNIAAVSLVNKEAKTVKAIVIIIVKSELY